MAGLNGWTKLNSNQLLAHLTEPLGHPSAQRCGEEQHHRSLPANDEELGKRRRTRWPTQGAVAASHCKVSMVYVAL